jgi:hypothetical protein
VLILDSLQNNNIDTMAISKSVDNEYMDLDPYLMFSNAIRSPLTRQKYKGRLRYFFDFITIPDAPIEERCKIFVNNCNKKDGYALNSIFRYVIFLKGRIEKKEIVVSTLHNHLKPIKLLCE